MGKNGATTRNSAQANMAQIELLKQNTAWIQCALCCPAAGRGNG